MSFFKRLFGLGGGGEDARPTAAKVAAEIEHDGYVIKAMPFKEGGQFQTCALIAKEIDGVVKEHRLIRADRFADEEDAVAVSLRKAKQMIDEQGDRLFG